MRTMIVNAKTARGAARQTFTHLTKLAKELGCKGSSLPTYRDEKDGFDAPTVCWGDLFEWAIVLSSGGNMLNNELGQSPWSDEPEITLERNGWIAEPLNPCALSFSKA